MTATEEENGSHSTDNQQGDNSTKAKYGRLDDPNPRMTAEEMDVRRRENIAYEYLCHLEEAKNWIEACIGEELPTTTEIEECLRNGVFLAKLGHFMSADTVLLKKIYDKDQMRYKANGLHFRHTDNINHWLQAMEVIGVPKIFFPETTDIYDKKNIPKTIYCIHALSLYLFKLGKAPQIQDLYGKVKFTDEEISAMRLELEKYGIQMPTFSKIGGILANEMPVDEAALHAAVIAVNDAIDRQDADCVLTALQNPVVQIVNVQANLRHQYLAWLYDARETKAENARNKSLDPDSSYIPDVYDELLTQAEIQGNLNVVNTNTALAAILAALDSDDCDALLGALREPLLSLRGVAAGNIMFYAERLTASRHAKRVCNSTFDVNDVEADASVMTRDDVQQAVQLGNEDGDKQLHCRNVVESVDSALESRDCELLMRALQHPAAAFPHSFSFAASLYLEEFCLIRSEKGAPLDWDEIAESVKVLSAIAKINEAVDAGDPRQTFSSLMDPNAHIDQLDASHTQKYQEALEKTFRQKKKIKLMTHRDVQEQITAVNMRVHQETERIAAVDAINAALDASDPHALLLSLQSPAAALEDVESASRQAAYLVVLTQRRNDKAHVVGDPQTALWWEEVQDGVRWANDVAQRAHQMSVTIAAVNLAVDSGNRAAFASCLANPAGAISRFVPDIAAQCFDLAQQRKESKSALGECGSGWMMNRTAEGFKFYFNISTLENSWERGSGIRKDHSLLTRDELQSCVDDADQRHKRQMLFSANEELIVRLQAAARGMLARRTLRQRRQQLYQHEGDVVKIQSWFRMQSRRSEYQRRISFLSEQSAAVVKIQSQVRAFLTRKQYLDRLKFFADHEDSIIKIQAFVKSNWAKQDYIALMRGQNPSISVLRKFVHLLDQTDIDYCEEIELEKLRQQVVSDIRSNQRLESDLNQMDIKIGLLVKNRITIQDVVSQHKSLRKYHDSSGSSLHGLKALSKASRERLEGYQHLFYLLQTHPTYLARLIFEMPQSRTTEFMKSVILTLYNYASNHREEYLLTKLFQTALQEEIRSKVNKLSDISTGNPMVIKMIVSHNRSARGGVALRELLRPLVLGVLADRSLVINTNPVEVYKQWVNQLESNSGEPCGLPYDVTPEEALRHQDVRSRLDGSIQNLRRTTDVFLAAILGGVGKIPYCMRYMAKTLYSTLQDKFPLAPEKDILKVIGNLIYYRYINSAIVAPDGFDIIDVRASKGLTNDQRRNLASIAKILQFAASNKGFGGDSAHLGGLNTYIMESHSRFKQFLREVCHVAEPEVCYNVDQYTDAVRVTKPVIYISVAELVETHRLLLSHQDKIAPEHNDPLHELLDDVGDVPDVVSLLGESCPEDGSSVAFKAHLAKTEISLTLCNKFEVPEESSGDLKSLMICTKRTVVDVIQCQKRGDNLAEVLATVATAAEDRSHAALSRRRDIVDRRAIDNKAKLVRQQSLNNGVKIPLELMKEKIKRNLTALEAAGLVSHEDDFQSLINSIVQDIRNQRLYRQRRKQEMIRLRDTLRSLKSKRCFHEEQVDYYNQYVQTCLDNLSSKHKRSGGKKAGGGLFSLAIQKARGSVKYSAARLHERGVVLEIEGLPIHQFKNVMFEIAATDTAGVFNVNAKLMGVTMEKVEVVFQDLLQLQYEGVAVMQMFDKAKINVNLLIFLLNKKFYGKK